ncbi:DDE Tnp4 domain-containing protein [Trichostrongylus colubriformis]|uniref:DDE Tnp4 domain-containing protein n=1 Tax=Trichostrongylus colubriformis TaxID=6319 RepID=A0AAN8FYI5_TRICO
MHDFQTSKSLLHFLVENRRNKDCRQESGFDKESYLTAKACRDMTQREIVQLWDALDELYGLYGSYLRLFIFMRFVTHGYSFAALAEEIHCEKSTVISAVYEVADAIRKVLFAEAFPPFTRADLEDIALKTQQRFDYPRAVAFMDGKHIKIKRPAHSGAQYYNYKKNYSIILLALVDCDYRILAFDLGAPGRVEYAEVYRRSNIKRFLDAKDEVFPPTRTLGSVGPVQYHILVNRGFGQDYRFVGPYSQSSANTPSKRKFNQKHSGAWRMVESAFGLLCQRFGILQRTLQVEPANAIKIVTSLLVLHNLLARREHALEFEERYPIPPQKLVTMQHENPQSPKRGALAASRARKQMTAHYDNLYGVHQ